MGGFKGGGIDILEISADGSSITPLAGGAVDMPKRAGYLAYAPKAGVLYSVDERKTDGRGPKKPASSVMAFKVDQESGALTFLNQQPTVGAMPASITVDEDKKLLWTANHGFFDHVVKAVQLADGTWVEKFEYDDSTVVQYGLNDDGSIAPVQDVHVLTGYGTDPNDSPAGRRPRAGQPSRAHRRDRPLGQVHGGVREGRASASTSTGSAARDWSSPPSTSARRGPVPGTSRSTRTRTACS